MERIWTLPPVLSEPLRRPVLRAAARFLERGTILEPGCGSGWPGRLLLAENDALQIAGADISEEQILLAQRAAEAAGVASRARYCRAEMGEVDLAEYSGAFVHAALHHLSDVEVQKLLDSLARAPRGFKVAFYEPVFVERWRWLPRRLARVVCRLLQVLKGRLVPGGLRYDEELLNEMKALQSEAEAEGWFLSPKEVPFERRWLFVELERRFDVVLARPVHFDAIEVAQRLAAIASPDDLAVVSPRILERALKFDRALLSTGLYRTCESRYAFWLIGVTSRGDATSAAATGSAAAGGRASSGRAP